jgi:hypothetical protein
MKASDWYALLATISFFPSAVGIYDARFYALVPFGYGLAIASIWLNRWAHRRE